MPSTWRIRVLSTGGKGRRFFDDPICCRHNADALTPPISLDSKLETELGSREEKGDAYGPGERELQVVPHELEEWRRVFIERGQLGLKSRSRDPGERELIRTRAKLGEMTMRMELAEELLEKRGYADEQKKLLKRGRE